MVLNVSDSETAETAFADIMKNAAKYCPDARVEGVLITPMLEKGMEMIIGVNNDPQFGPMLMVGMGGVFVEIFRDVAIYPAPLTRTETMKMIQSLKAYKLLDGYRGGAVYDVDALCDMIVNIGKFAIANKNIYSILSYINYIDWSAVVFPCKVSSYHSVFVRHMYREVWMAVSSGMSGMFWISYMDIFKQGRKYKAGSKK